MAGEWKCDFCPTAGKVVRLKFGKCWCQKLLMRGGLRDDGGGTQNYFFKTDVL